jgi:tRNA uridine 5-carboxymethylaminomethyl modification enzyme
LTERAFDAGLVTEKRFQRFKEKMHLLEQARTMAVGIKINGTPLTRLLKQADFEVRNLPGEALSCAPLSIWELIQTDFKYEGYAARQFEQNQRIERKGSQKIPDGLNYDRIAGLRSETRQKLSSLRPTSLGQAARISGITPSDVSILHIWLNRNPLHDDLDAQKVR